MLTVNMCQLVKRGVLSVSDWDARRKRKIADITQALSVSPVDVAALRRMAISEGGLLTDEIRCQVWPRLLNVPPQVLDQEPGIMLAILCIDRKMSSIIDYIHI